MPCPEFVAETPLNRPFADTLDRSEMAVRSLHFLSSVVLQTNQIRNSGRL